MIKRNILALCLIFLPLIATAQTSSAYQRGYQGGVSIGTLCHFDKDAGAAAVLETVHGFRFGNGVFLGVGVGIYAQVKTFIVSESPYIPLFLEGRYTFLEKKVSPYVSFRSGGVFFSDGEDNRLANQIGAGLAMNHLSFGIGYQYSSGFRRVRETIGQDLFLYPSRHSFSCSFSIWF